MDAGDTELDWTQGQFKVSPVCNTTTTLITGVHSYTIPSSHPILRIRDSQTQTDTASSWQQTTDDRTSVINRATRQSVTLRQSGAAGAKADAALRRRASRRHMHTMTMMSALCTMYVTVRHVPIRPEAAWAHLGTCSGFEIRLLRSGYGRVSLNPKP